MAAFHPAKLLTRATRCRHRMPSLTVAAAASAPRPSLRSLRWTRSETVSGQNPSQAIELSSPLFSDDFASAAGSLCAAPSCASAVSFFEAGSGLLGCPPLGVLTLFFRLADVAERSSSKGGFSVVSALLPNDQRRVLGAGNRCA